VANSASCYDQIEDIGILPIVETERKFIEIQGQIVLADMMVIANNPALQETPKALDIIRVDLAARIRWLCDRQSGAGRNASNRDSRCIRL
jgi:hypothetical protein